MRSEPLSIGCANPVLLAFHDLWQAKRGAAALPARSAFAMEDFRPFMGRMSILSVEEAGTNFRFRLCGSDFTDAYGAEMTGKSVRDLRPGYVAAMLPGFRHCLASLQPLHIRGDVNDGIALFRWEHVVVPVGEDGVQADRLLVCAQTLSHVFHGDKALPRMALGASSRKSPIFDLAK